MTFHHLKPVSCFIGMKNNILLAQITSLGAQKNQIVTPLCHFIDGAKVVIYFNPHNFFDEKQTIPTKVTNIICIFAAKIPDKI